MTDKIVCDKTCSQCNKTFTATLEKHSLLGWPTKPSTFKANDTGVCEACSKAEAEKRELHKKNKHLFWTPETINKHFEKHVPVAGQDLILLYKGYALPGEVSYTLVKVESVQVKPKRKLIINTAPPHGGRVFWFSGKNTFAPKGQSLLLPYHKALGELIAEKGVPLFKDQDHLVEAQISLEELKIILGDQDGPVAQ